MESISAICNSARETFRYNVNSVRTLMEFDDILIRFAINAVRDLHNRLKVEHGINNPKYTAEGTLRQLENIRENKSLTPSYEKIYNSCLVLLVSYFGSSVSEMFKRSIKAIVEAGQTKKIGKEEIKLTVDELKEMDFNVLDAIGNIIGNKSDISFQDMQSIQRAFKTYFEIDVEKDQDVNNIILAQASRHSIVHSGAKAERKMIRQVEFARPRNVKEIVLLDQELHFTQDELKLMIESMTKYLEKLSAKMTERYPD